MAEQDQKKKGTDSTQAYHERENRRKWLEAEVVRLNAEIDDLSRLKSVESDLKTVKSQLTKAQSELNIANADLKKFKEKNEELTDKLSKLNQGNESLTKVDAELNRVKQELTTVKSQNKDLNQEQEKLKQINQALNTEVARLTGIETDLTKQATGLKRQVEDLTKVNKDLTEINEALNWDSEQLKQINEAKSRQNYWGMIALNTLMVFTALAASFANVIHLGERYLALIKDPTDLDRIVCYVSMTVFDLCIFFFAIYGKHILARIFAGAIMFIVFTKLATPFFQYGLQPEYIERFLVGMAFSGFLAFVSVVMSEVIAEKINKQNKPKQ